MHGRHLNVRRHGRAANGAQDNSSDNTDSYDIEQRRQGVDAPRGCMVTAWAFCVVGATVLVIPVVLFLLPLIEARLLASPLRGPTAAPATTTATPAAETTSSAPPREQCLRPTFSVNGAENLTGFPHLSPGFVQRTDFFVVAQQVYCIYNVSRFRRPNGHGFLPAHVPFSLCPNLVYWSWSFSGGKLTSRAKDFDRKFGLEVIHSVWNNQKKAQLRRSPLGKLEPLAVLLTMGGFSEDSPDFYSLENNEFARQNLVHDVFQAYRHYNLSGINLHWVPDSESCERTYGSGFPRLGKFLDSLRKLVNLNIDTSSSYKVAAMLDPRSQRDMSLFHSLRGRLDLAFFRTHSPPDSDFPDHNCDSSVLELQSLLSRLTPYFEKKSTDTKPARQYYRNLCMSLSLELIAREGSRGESAAPALPVSATRGRMALFELCDSNRSFASVASTRTAGCEVRRSTGPAPYLTYAVEYADTLQAKMELLGFRENACVLLYDLDFDNFQRACFAQEFLMLQHFLKARYPTRSFNLFSHLP